MTNTRFTTSALRASLVAATMTVAAVLAAGTAHAGSPDDHYLGMLAHQGIGFGDVDSAIAVAHHVCVALDQGMEPRDISTDIAGANPGVDGQTALVITVDAALSYCPQFAHDMGDGRTVVGPNH